jgi:hypothetical protein
MKAKERITRTIPQPPRTEYLMVHLEDDDACRDAVIAERERVLVLIETELTSPPMYSQKNRVADLIRKLREGSP